MTQTPKDVPDDVLAQLGSRVQHQLRAHTPNDAKALKQTVATFPRSGYDLAEVLQQLGIGEAVVTVMDPDGAPTPVAWTRMIAPQSLMAPTPEDVLRPGVAMSSLMGRYGQAVDRDSPRRCSRASSSRVRRPRPPSSSGRRRPAGAGGGRAAGEGRRPGADRGGAGERSARSSRPRASSRRQEKGMVEQIAGSTVFRQFARSAGREIVRGLFGAARRR